MIDDKIQLFKCEKIRSFVDLTDVVIDNTKNYIGGSIDNDKIFVKNLSGNYYDHLENTKYVLTHNFYYKSDDRKDNQSIQLMIKKFCVNLFLEENRLTKDNVVNLDCLSDAYKMDTLQGVDFKFDTNKVIINLATDIQLENPYVLLFNAQESIIDKVEYKENQVMFHVDTCLHNRDYKVLLLDKAQLYEISIQDPDIVSLEPFILVKESAIKLSYENGNLVITKTQLKSYISIEKVQILDGEISLTAHVNKDQVPVTSKMIYVGRTSQQMVESNAEVTNKGLLTSVVPIHKLLGDRFIDVYVYLSYENYEELCHLSGKESYFEKKIKISDKEFSIQTTRERTIEIEIIKEKSWITKKINNIRYKFIRVLEKKVKVNPNLAIFESYGGRQYSCHPRAIYEYIRSNKPEITCLWSVEPGCERVFKENNIPYVKRFSIRWFLVMVKSKYWISNTRFPLWVQKPEGTIYLQTWHGTPLKRLGTDINEVHMPKTDTFNYNRNFYRESRNWDYLVSPNRFSTNVFSRAFSICSEKIIESGSPRNDFLVRNNDNLDLINKIKKEYNLPLDKKVVLYAPTWRDDQYFDKAKYKFNTALDLKKLKESLSDEFIVILRMHYLVADNIDLKGFEDFAYNISSGDITQLYLVSDILITDYSSVYFDYAVLKRPMIFFMYDIDDYRDRLRGFYLDVNTTIPGPIVQTNEDLIHEIKNVDSTNEKLQQFLDVFCKLEDGNATRRVCDIVFKNN